MNFSYFTNVCINNNISAEFFFHFLPGVKPHLSLFLIGQTYEFLYFLNKVLRVLHSGDKTIFPVIYNISAASIVGSDDGAACGAALQQHIGHALRVK